MGPLSSSVHVSLDGILSFYCVNCITQLGICKLAEGAPDLVVYVIDKNIKDHKICEDMLLLLPVIHCGCLGGRSGRDSSMKLWRACACPNKVSFDFKNK